MAKLLLAPFDETQYFAEWQEGNDTSRWRLFSSRVGQARIFNVQPLGVTKEHEAWMFLKASIDASGVLVVDLLEKGSMKELKDKRALNEIRLRSSDATLFSGFARCTREAQ